MKLILLAILMIITTASMAHVSQSHGMQHVSEHFLLVVLFIPLAWFAIRKFLK